MSCSAQEPLRRGNRPAVLACAGPLGRPAIGTEEGLQAAPDKPRKSRLRSLAFWVFPLLDRQFPLPEAKGGQAP